MVNLFWEIKEKVGHPSNVYVDASFPATALRTAWVDNFKPDKE